MSDREQTYDHTYDVVVVGTGAAGFATAMGAIDEGLSVLLVESTDKWGGSTAMSGGGMWMPDNPLMRRDRVGDSREEALTYLEATVGDAGPATDRARKEAFVDGVEDFVVTAEKHGMVFARAADYPDYYPERPGGKIGRAIEIEPHDSRKLGPWWGSLRSAVPLPAKTDDVWLLGRAWSTPSGFVRGAQLVFRALGGVVTGKRLVGIGNALATAFCKAVVIDGRAPMWLETPMDDLIVDDGRVTGITVTRDGRTERIRATRGVMLASGGFEANVEWRRKHHGIDGAPSGNPGNVGHPIEVAARAGAALDLMDDAWWGASIATVDGEPASFIVGERSMPFSLMVDAKGARFANESESYVDLGHHMLEHDKDGAYWLVFDARHGRRYLRMFAMDPRQKKAWAQAGITVKAPTLAGLADAMGVDPETFRATIERFNGFARTGVDGEFGRGNSAYDRYYGDPLVHPNPNLGPIEKGPFVAYRVVVGDLGTKGGVLTDAHARALRADGSIIEGLYAAGNCSASVMGRTYPGPGSTIGPAVVFGLRGARHMAAARA
ncbi:FAD-dependent oxidoreductase [Cellulomonas sp. zg-ZUI199]|uniref:FAD-dependent oxidoreductase n=1 Tax=Cellulomonas wangleii TaxID=2816956 RepID=A0ABX8D613_9CELL|nr:FAD-binding protein [Cellulomonas wangleii]MBO0924264.1 FAD-dependent oxidoreductase [Cellulomonas wangleii]QVI62275.1 FAD-dependent oxidoreductase [Cellulomonas wangleii]